MRLLNCEERTIYLLLIEDSPADVELIRQSFAHLELAVTVGVVRDGQDALELLTNSTTSVALRPDLIVLDIGLPTRDGFQVLEAIQSDDVLRRLPVVILTQSDDSNDKERARQLSVSEFITKPRDLDGYVEVARKIATFAKTKSNGHAAMREPAVGR